jgi:uncharacterized membrane protein
MVTGASIWTTIAILCIGTVAIKASGPVSLGGRELPQRAAHVIALVGPAVLASLVAYETFANGSYGVTVDARVVGLAAAAIALALRLPIAFVVVLAAAATALARAL